MIEGTLISGGGNDFTIENLSSLLLNDGAGTYIQFSNSDHFVELSGTKPGLISSDLRVGADSIYLLLHNGQANISSLRVAPDTIGAKPMTYNPNNGRWEYLDYWPKTTSVPLSGITAPTATNIIAMGGFNFGLTGGKFGVGISPNYTLDILSSDAGLFATNIYNNSATGHGLAVSVNNTGSTISVLQALSGSGGTTSVLDVKANGKVGIGTSSPDSTLTLIGSLRASSNVLFGSLAGTGSRAVLADANGTLSAPVSDRSVKQNIQSLDYGLNTIMKLNPVSFEYIDSWKNYGSGKQVGFIAQDIQNVMPNSVFRTPTTGKLGYNEQDLIPVLTKALQELNLRVIKLEQENAKLKIKN